MTEVFFLVYIYETNWNDYIFLFHKYKAFNGIYTLPPE